MTLDLEGSVALVEHLDLGGGVRLDPDRRSRRTRVTKQRAENQPRLAGRRAAGFRLLCAHLARLCSRSAR